MNAKIYNRWFPVTCLYFILTILFVLPVFGSTSEAYRASQLQCSPVMSVHLEGDEPKQGDDFAVTVSINDLSVDCNAVSYYFDVQYDTEQVAYEDFEKTGTISATGDLLVNDMGNGTLRIGYMRSGDAFTGPSNLLKISFHALQGGDAVLTLANAFINGKAIAILQHATVHIASLQEICTPLVTIADTFTYVNRIIEIPVYTEDIESDCQIISYLANLKWDTEILEYNGYSTTGTLSEGLQIEANETATGISIGAMSTLAISGQDTIIKLQFIAKKAGSTLIEFDQFFYNGYKSTNLRLGSIVVHPLSAICTPGLTLSDCIAYKNNTCEVIVSIGELLSECQVISGYVDIRYNPEYLTYTGYTASECLLSGTDIAVNSSGDNLRVGFMSTTALNGQGALLKLQFTANKTGNTNLTPISCFYNTMENHDLSGSEVVIFPADSQGNNLLTGNYPVLMHPVSPDVASMAKYAVQPVGMYTGVAPITVPVTGVSGKSLSVPVSATCYTGGIKVEEIASSIGLGWTLQAGGVITRQVNGYPDDTYQTSPVEKYGFINGGGDMIPDITSANFSDAAVKALLEQFSNGGIYDGQPDVFYFNINGRAGSFIFDKEGVPHSLHYENIKIEPDIDNHQLVGWEIIDESGIRYIFEQADREISSYTEQCNTSGNYDKSYTSAWYLSRIVSPGTDDVIYFDYEDYTIEIPMVKSRSLEVRIDTVGLAPVYSECVNYTQIDCKRLTAIRAPMSTADFEYGNIRADIHNPSLGGEAKVLDKIILSSYQGKEIRAVRFNTAYYTSTGRLCSHDEALRIVTDYPDSITSLRLVLTDIINVNGSGAIIKSFEYTDEINGQPAFLPDRLSGVANTDHWGYFNGYTAGTGIPQISYTDLGGNVLSLGDATKEADISYALLGTLQKTINPLGGETTYEYGLNTAYTDLLSPDQSFETATTGGLRIQEVRALTGDNSPDEVHVYSYDDNTGKTSGTLNTAPRYGDYILNDGAIYFRAVVYSNYNLVLPHVSYTGYGQITKLKGETGQNGRSEYTYYTSGGNGADKIDYAFVSEGDVYPQQTEEFPVTNVIYLNSQLGNIDMQALLCGINQAGWRTGLLKTSKHYDVNNTLVKETSNHYIFQPGNTSGEPIIGSLLTNYYDISSQPGSGDYYKGLYYYMYTRNGVLVDSSVTRTYNTVDADYTQKSIKYGYNDNKLVNSLTTYDKQGQEISRAAIKYVSDYEQNSSYPALEALVLQNRLSSTVESKTYKNNLLTGAAYTAYDIVNAYPRTTESYVFESLEPIDETQFTGCNQYGALPVGHDYTKVSTIDYYDNGDVKSIQKEHGNKMSTIYGYDNFYTIASVVNADAEEVLVENFENGNSHNWAGHWMLYTDDQSTISDSVATGRSSLKMPLGAYYSTQVGIPVSQLDPAGKYTVTARVMKSSTSSSNPALRIDFTGNGAMLSIAATNVEGQWQYLEKTFYLSQYPGCTEIAISLQNDQNGLGNSCDVFFDDIIFYPADAMISTSTFDPLVGVTSQTNQNGLSTYYQYDSLGRLTTIRDDDKYIRQVKEHDLQPFVYGTVHQHTFDYQGGNFSFTALSNADWDIDSGSLPAWLTIDSTTGNGTSQLTLTAAQNSTGNPRSYQLVLQSMYDAFTVTIAQNAE